MVFTGCIDLPWCPQAAEVDQEVVRQRDLQQRQRQKAMLAQKAARIDQSLHSKVRSGADPAKLDTFSRAREQGSFLPSTPFAD